MYTTRNEGVKREEGEEEGKEEGRMRKGEAILKVHWESKDIGWRIQLIQHYHF